MTDEEAVAALSQRVLEWLDEVQPSPGVVVNVALDLLAFILAECVEPEVWQQYLDQALTSVSLRAARGRELQKKEWEPAQH